MKQEAIIGIVKEELSKRNLLPDEIAAYFSSVDQLYRPILLDYDVLSIDWNTLVGNDDFGLKCESMYTAGSILYFLKHLNRDDPWVTMKMCILVGGDVDTLASVVGSIAGVLGLFDFANFENIPKWTIDDLENFDHLIDIGKQLTNWYYHENN